MCSTAAWIWAADLPVFSPQEEEDGDWEDDKDFVEAAAAQLACPEPSLHRPDASWCSQDLSFLGLHTDAPSLDEWGHHAAARTDLDLIAQVETLSLSAPPSIGAPHSYAFSECSSDGNFSDSDWSSDETSETSSRSSWSPPPSPTTSAILRQCMSVLSHDRNRSIGKDRVKGKASKGLVSIRSGRGLPVMPIRSFHGAAALQ
mmetsp:Transcript_19468/g.47742  ORF Transcript_19468/g.47742 Transcript_19468/m.47742 type:complete len:202 (-) Transcript_19468:229-834(-)